MAVVVASLAVSCAGLLVNPSPLDFEVYTSAGHALGHGASPRLLSGVPVLGVLTANAFVVGVALVAGAGLLLPTGADLTRRGTRGERSRSSVP